MMCSDKKKNTLVHNSITHGRCNIYSSVNLDYSRLHRPGRSYSTPMVMFERRSPSLPVAQGDPSVASPSAGAQARAGEGEMGVGREQDK